jgi:hypothetical protein
MLIGYIAGYLLIGVGVAYVLRGLTEDVLIESPGLLREGEADSAKLGLNVLGVLFWPLCFILYAVFLLYGLLEGKKKWQDKQ